jgi:hypothetical protein
MQWADYSGGRPSGAALRGAGFGGVIRYVGLGGGASLPGKRITAAEYRDLTGAGVQVLLVCEGDTTDAWGGYAAGVANARIALADARELGIPDSVGIAAAADAHAANQAQINAAVEYARGFQDVLGKARAGFYGFQETVTAVRNAGIGSWYWRCGSEPSGTVNPPTGEKSWTHLWQRNKAPTVRVVSGVTCDINEQYLPISRQEDDLTPEQWAFIKNALTFNDQCNRTIINQITGDPKGEPSFDANMNWQDGHLPGFPNGDGSHHFTLTDFARQSDWNSYTSRVNTENLLDAVNSLATGGVDVAALAEALKDTLAPDIVKALGEKLTD